MDEILCVCVCVCVVIYSALTPVCYAYMYKQEVCRGDAQVLCTFLLFKIELHHTKC